MKDGPQKIRAQQLGQFSRIDAVALIAHFQQGIFPRITDHQLRDLGLEQGIQPGRTSAFFEGHMQATAQPAQTLENAFRFRFHNAFHHYLAHGI